MFWNWGAFNKDADVPICLSYAKEEEPVIRLFVIQSALTSVWSAPLWSSERIR